MVLTISFLIALAVMVFVVLLLHRERNFWYRRYEQRDAEAKQERDHLFSQLLLASGKRPTSEPIRPERVVHQRQVDPDEQAWMENVIAEANSLQRITASEGLRLMGEVAAGKITRSEMERLIWQWKQPEYPGSVADI